MTKHKHHKILILGSIFLAAMISITAISYSPQKLVDYYIMINYVNKPIQHHENLFSNYINKTSSTKYTILFFLDGSNCTSCHIHSIIEYIDRASLKTNNDVSGILITSHPLIGNDSISASNSPNIKIVQDYNKKLKKQLWFVDRERYNTILIDNKNVIKAIGNPLTNPEISDLFNKIVIRTGHKNYKDTKTNICIDDYKINLGTINYNSTKDTVFSIKNKGSHKLVIYECTTSCGCINIKYPKFPILPNDSSNIKIQFKPIDKGKFSKTLFLRCNAEESPLLVKIYGIVK